MLHDLKQIRKHVPRGDAQLPVVDLQVPVDAQRATPWRMGDAHFPVAPAELLAADERLSIVGSCAVIKKSPEHEARIDAAVAAMEESLPCWRQGSCHEHASSPCHISRHTMHCRRCSSPT